MTAAEREKIALERARIESHLPEWAHEFDLHSGIFKNKPHDLQDHFAEWLETKEPGLGARCKELFGVLLWKRTFARVFPRFKHNTGFRTKKAYFQMNKVLMPKIPTERQEIKPCPTCGNLYRAPVAPPTDEELRERVKNLQSTPLPSGDQK